MLNFDNPYFAVNPKDFWARWHVSLSSWLRDYLYISLGGNRRGRGRTYVNLALTMLLGGLWHGAAWTFVAWGAFHGAMLVVYHAWAEKFSPKGTADSGRWLWPRRIFFFQLTCLGWLLFRAESLGQVGDLLRRIFTDFAWDAQAADALAALVLFCLPLWLVQLLR
jgi:D-alanyl-lipoteichoic acid acyltransferase DltB (MBOAT superfamily)